MSQTQPLRGPGGNRRRAGGPATTMTGTAVLRERTRRAHDRCVAGQLLLVQRLHVDLCRTCSAVRR